MTSMTATDYDSPEEPRDDGAARDTRPAKACCKRITQGLLYGWCLLADGHDGECGGAMSESVTIQWDSKRRPRWG